MKRSSALFFTTAFLFVFIVSPTRAAGPPAAKPNLIIIMADDMGYADLGCYGSEIATPNIDRLAAGGIRFTQFYNTARCCPTRAALLTGLYSHQAGLGHMVNDLGFPPYQGFLNDRCVTIAEALKPAGYRTYMAGKWHVGENRPHWPVDRGFDRSYSLISGGTNYFKLDEGRKLARDGESITPEPGWYLTDAIGEHAVKFVGEHERSKPFFLYVAFTSPHWPLHALDADVARYRGKYRLGWDELRKRRHARMIELGLVDARWALTPRDASVPAWDALSEQDRDEHDLRMAVYAAQIDRMDQNVGKLLAKLKEVGAEQNTLVMVLADNGGCAEIIERSEVKAAPTGVKESFRSYGVGWANASNTPFRLYKHWSHEGGISTPLVVSWPAVVKGNGSNTITNTSRITNQPRHLIDLMATCLDVAGAKYPATFKGKELIPLEGKSLRPIFDGKTRVGHDALFWEHEGNRAVRQGKWKLVSRHPGEWELYDLEADRGEMNNLAAQQVSKVKELAAAYERWAEKCGVRSWPVRR